MAAVDLFSTYGDYADGYCEDWAPGSYDDYADGYVSLPALFVGFGLSFAPARLPGYPVYTLSWEQAAALSTGADTVAYAPYVQELLLRLSWAGITGAEKSSLEAFFAAADGGAASFIYSNAVTGPSLPVRFAGGQLPAMPEVAYDRYKAEITLRVGINYPQMDAPGTPAAITGNRFVLGGVAMAFPAAKRPSSGYALELPQTMERDTLGRLIVYDKSRHTIRRHALDLALDYDGFIRLQAFFFTFAHGRRKTFLWYDDSGTSRTVRLASAQIVVTQVSYNRYTCQIQLLEEA